MRKLYSPCYIEVVVYCNADGEEVEHHYWDYNNKKTDRAAYINLLHKTIRDNKLTLEITRIDKSDMPA